MPPAKNSSGSSSSSGAPQNSISTIACISLRVRPQLTHLRSPRVSTPSGDTARPPAPSLRTRARSPSHRCSKRDCVGRHRDCEQNKLVRSKRLRRVKPDVLLPVHVGCAELGFGREEVVSAVVQLRPERGVEVPASKFHSVMIAARFQHIAIARTILRKGCSKYDLSHSNIR
eukprot:2794193-Rhodomonas_salina.1